MTPIETVYLILVVVAWLVFAGTLAVTQIRANRYERQIKNASGRAGFPSDRSP